MPRLLLVFQQMAMPDTSEPNRAHIVAAKRAMYTTVQPSMHGKTGTPGWKHVFKGFGCTPFVSASSGTLITVGGPADPGVTLAGLL
jgi:hypothetical protein